MIALLKKPGERAQRVDLPDDEIKQLAAMQVAVGGYIEIAVRGRDFVVWCDEEGRLADPPRPTNFHRPTDSAPIVGAVVVTGPMSEEVMGLPEMEIKRISDLLDLWATAGPLCGTDPEHYDADPFDPCDIASAVKISQKRRLHARILEASIKAGAWEAP